jgi:hypothetical protein
MAGTQGMVKEGTQQPEVRVFPLAKDGKFIIQVIRPLLRWFSMAHVC